MAKSKLLPDFIVQDNRVKAVIDEAEQMIESANKHLAKLKAEGIPTDLATLKVICKNDEAFKDWTRKAEASYIGKLGFVPKEERKRIHKTFEDLINRTDSPRSCINGFLFNRRGYEPIQHKDGNLSLDIAKIEAEAEMNARKYFSDEDKKYFILLLDIEEAYKKLQYFERTNQYVPYSVDDDFSRVLKTGFSPEWFALYHGFKIGKMNPRAKEMLEEMKDDE